MKTALHGIRVLDLTRVLAGPWCAQNLADLGADVIKVERPGAGDDTRSWGPPFLKDRDGHDTADAAYYLAANRDKRSVTIDLAAPAGQQVGARPGAAQRCRARELQGRTAEEVRPRLRQPRGS